MFHTCVKHVSGQQSWVKYVSNVFRCFCQKILCKTSPLHVSRGDMQQFETCNNYFETSLKHHFLQCCKFRQLVVAILDTPGRGKRALFDPSRSPLFTMYRLGNKQQQFGTRLCMSQFVCE